MTNEEILKEALEYFTGMYGFRLERNDYDGEIEYSCNGYVVDEDTVELRNIESGEVKRVQISDLIRRR